MAHLKKITHDDTWLNDSRVRNNNNDNKSQFKGYCP